LTRRTISLAVMDLFFLEVKAVQGTSATWASLTQQASWSSQMARGVLMGTQVSSPMPAIAALTWEFICTVTEKNAPAARTAPVKASE